MTEQAGAALVTGAAKRLGRAMALTLAQEGFAVAIHYHHSADEAEATAGDVRALGRQAVTIQANLASIDEVMRIVPQATAALGPLTVLVNNASTFERDRLDTLTPERWRRQLDANLMAPTFLAQALAAQLPHDAEGLIVNLCDSWVHSVMMPKYLSYSVSKAGLWAVTQMLARELAPRIRVNAIAPGPTLPPPGWTDEQFRPIYQNTPLRRGTSLDEITGGLRFLLHARAMTGQMLVLDSGFSPGAAEAD